MAIRTWGSDLCMMTAGLADATPQFCSVTPILVGLNTAWEMSNFVCLEKWDLFPIKQLTSFVFSLFVFFLWRCVLSNLTWTISAVLGTYFITSVCDVIVWLLLTAGLALNFMCNDFDWLKLIFNFFNHFSVTFNCSCRLSEAITVPSWAAYIAVLEP
jgi:hypothetical protein